MVAVLNTAVLPSLRLSVDEYLQAQFPKGYRYELVHGQVFMSPNPSAPHEWIVSSIAECLFHYKRTRPDVVKFIAFHGAVAIADRQNVREPDIVVYSTVPTPDARWSFWKEFIPLLAVEVVSPGQEERDYVSKREDYWQAGVGEYWIVDPLQANVHLLTRGEKDWSETVICRGESLTSKSLPGLGMPISDILPARP